MDNNYCLPTKTRRYRHKHIEVMSLALLALLPSMACAAPSVLVTDGLARKALSLLSSRGLTVVEKHLAPEELAAGGLAEYDAVIIRSATTLSADAIAAGSRGRLRIIGRAGVGVDNVDLDAAQLADCWVLNTPGASTSSVVELTLAHMLAAARGLQAADEGLKSGRWLKGQIRLGSAGGPRPGHELAGKRLGLLGFGRIAQATARTASALGMTVSAYARSPSRSAAEELGVTLVPSSADLFATCTHVVVLCSLSDETRGMVDRNRIDLMPSVGADGTLCGSHLFNMARGGIVVEADVAAALQDSTLSTYAADVFEREPPPESSPLLRCANFHGTPHVGAATLEAQTRGALVSPTDVLVRAHPTPCSPSLAQQTDPARPAQLHASKSRRPRTQRSRPPYTLLLPPPHTCSCRRPIRHA